MPRPTAPRFAGRVAEDAVPRRDPEAQIAPLADGRLLVRHRGGLSLLAGLTFEEVEEVLARVDGRRTVAELCAELAPGRDPAALLRLLGQLEGEVLAFEPPVQAELTPADVGTYSGPPIVVVGTEAAQDLAEGLRRAGLGEVVFVEAVHQGAPELKAASALVVWLEEAPLADLFDLVRRGLAAGLPSLAVVRDPDGLRIGPTAVPGVGACALCAQLAGLRFLGSPERELAATAARFRALPCPDEGTRRFAARAVAGELAALLAPGGEPELLGAVLWRRSSGEVRRLPVPHWAECEVCASAAEPRSASLADRAARVRVESLERQPRHAVREAVSPSDEGSGERVRSVGILGGGTAGYLAALALRARHPELEVTLVESSAVPVVGVGEATTPLMPQFLHVDLGLDIHELFREVRPTFKLGIRFDWGAPGRSFNYPFGKIDVLEPAIWDGDVEACSLRSLLMSASRLPLALDHRTAYHLDNAPFVAYLARKARERGVAVIDALIERVETRAASRGDRDASREVEALVAADGRRFAFDLYVDCSGFRSVLMGEALGSPFVDFGGSLFTDRAVVASVPHGGRIAPHTRAETMSAGWCWATPQVEADHRGYVFSSAYQTPEQAEREMRLLNPGMGEARLVRFRAGRRQHFFRGNVVALGNAYGFVEPLESTALHMLIRQIGLLLRAFPSRRDERALGTLFNRQVGGLWDYLAWFLALHYRFNRRLDTPFWRACREEVDVSRHGELLEAFRERGPLSYDPAIGAVFDYPDPLWGAEGIDLILLGQGVEARLPAPRTSREAWRERRRLAARVVDRSLGQARSLELLAKRPELLERIARAFRAVGPAFGSAASGPLRRGR